jgi:hypothetical protein
MTIFYAASVCHASLRALTPSRITRAHTAKLTIGPARLLSNRFVPPGRPFWARLHAQLGITRTGAIAFAFDTVAKFTDFYSGAIGT